jgi:hypothetical protein
MRRAIGVRALRGEPGKEGAARRLVPTPGDRRRAGFCQPGRRHGGTGATVRLAARRRSTAARTGARPDLLKGGTRPPTFRATRPTSRAARSRYQAGVHRVGAGRPTASFRRCCMPDTPTEYRPMTPPNDAAESPPRVRRRSRRFARAGRRGRCPPVPSLMSGSAAERRPLDPGHALASASASCGATPCKPRCTSSPPAF